MATVLPDKTVETMVTKAVAAIVLEDPFYGYLLLRQDIVQNPNIPTASTNGKRIQYNPKWMKQWSQPQIKGLLKHEVMHTAHLHHLRRGNREPEKWNMACDYVINALLVDAGVSLPDGGLVDPKHKDHSSEHVYNMLPDPPPGGGSGKDGFGPPWDIGGVEDAPGSEDASTRDVMEAEAKLEVMQAINAAKIQGKMPAGVDRLIDEIAQSKMPWKKLLARFFKSTGKNDYSWSKPNRRFIAHDIYLPSLYSEGLGEIVIGVDTSGSVGQAELQEFFGCVNGILKQTRPEAIHVIYCDAAVGSAQVLKPTDLPLTVKKFKPSGGGGTDFRPVFDYVTEKKLKPAVLIYLTDMYGTFPDKAPSYPVIWCATSQEKGPFGKTMEIK